jgi:hypothetical protein
MPGLIVVLASAWIAVSFAAGATLAACRVATRRLEEWPREHQQPARLIDRERLDGGHAVRNRHDQDNCRVYLVLRSRLAAIDIPPRVIVSNDVADSPAEHAICVVGEASGSCRGVKFLGQRAEILRIGPELDGQNALRGETLRELRRSPRIIGE